jgi:DNA-directed RNA polymerase subunit RPC12/RpoP
MHTTQTVRCPNCGSQAERRYFTSEEVIYRTCPSNQIIQTECQVCDYLMVMCSRNASIVEVYAPGISVSNHAKGLKRSSPILVNDNCTVPHSITEREHSLRLTSPLGKAGGRGQKAEGLIHL